MKNLVKIKDKNFRNRLMQIVWHSCNSDLIDMNHEWKLSSSPK